MGLALHNPADSLPDLAESRYLGPGRDPPLPAAKARKTRLSRAKYHTWCLRHDVYRDPETLLASVHNKITLRPHQLAILNATHRKIPRSILARPQKRSVPALPTVAEQEDYWKVTPARAESSPATRRRTPSLERQDAFADAKSTKKCHQRWAATGESPLEPEVAEAYRLGLLYDDEHLRGSGFGLNAIVHDEPVYTIRPSGRRRKGRTAAAYADSETYEKIDLPLDLSLAALGDDAALARYLVASTMSEDQRDEMLVDLIHDAPEVTRVIHGLTSTSNIQSAHVETCEKMDEDTDTDTEDSSPGVAEFPDLISDDDIDFGDNDWDVVRDDNDDTSDIDLAPFVGGGGGVAGGDNPDDWIMLD